MERFPPFAPNRGIVWPGNLPLSVSFVAFLRELFVSRRIWDGRSRVLRTDHTGGLQQCGSQ